MSDYKYTGLGVAVRETAGGELLELGVILDGAFVGFASRKTGDVTSAISEAAAAKSAAGDTSTDSTVADG